MLILLMFCERNNIYAKKISLLLAIVVFTLTSCGSSQIDQAITPHRISAQHPLYVLMTLKQQMVLAVINRPAYTLAGYEPIMLVGSYPPSGGIGVLSDGSVIVTHTASVVNGRQIVASETWRCTITTGLCSPIISGWGSSEVITNGQSIASPIWQDAAIHPSSEHFNGQLAIFSEPSAATIQKIQLADLPPGAIQFAPDGKSIYWLVVPTNSSNSASIIRFDVASQKIIASYLFSSFVPGDLAVAENGDVYVTITYSHPSRGSQGNTRPSPDSRIMVFNADLQVQKTISVGSEPLNIAVNSNQIAITYQINPTHADIYSQTDDALIQTIHSSYPIANISSLSDGDFAFIANDAVSSTDVGIWLPAENQLHWYTFTGVNIGNAAG